MGEIYILAADSFASRLLFFLSLLLNDDHGTSVKEKFVKTISENKILIC
jgi:hypothetical protein